jgi:ArsR family transcriptional regulator
MGVSMREIVKAFKALSEETKLRILNLLLERECCVCEVMQALDISQSKASRHLSALYDAGFLKLRRDGLWSLYSIDNEGMADYLAELVTAVRKALENNKIASRDRERLKKTQRVGVKCVRNFGRIASTD